MGGTPPLPRALRFFLTSCLFLIRRPPGAFLDDCTARAGKAPVVGVFKHLEANMKLITRFELATCAAPELHALRLIVLNVATRWHHLKMCKPNSRTALRIRCITGRRPDRAAFNEGVQPKSWTPFCCARSHRLMGSDRHSWCRRCGSWNNRRTGHARSCRNQDKC